MNNNQINKKNDPIININNLHNYPNILKKNYINKKMTTPIINNNGNDNVNDNNTSPTIELININVANKDFINVTTDSKPFLKKNKIDIESQLETETETDSETDSEYKVKMPISPIQYSNNFYDNCSTHCPDDQIANCFKSIEHIILSSIEYIKDVYRDIFNHNKYPDTRDTSYTNTYENNV